MCPIAYCGGCVKDAGFVRVRKRKGLCEECLPIVTMIERNQSVNSEGVQLLWVYLLGTVCFWGEEGCGSSPLGGGGVLLNCK
jgi:hypothetical protein